MDYALDFSQISTALATNHALRTRVLALVASRPILGKAFEGPGRVDRFREVLRRMIEEDLTLAIAYEITEDELPAWESAHAHNSKVFPSRWGERLIRTQYSRFYNQAVLELLAAAGHTRVFVAHSADEGADSRCTRELAGRNHDLKVLQDRLISAFERGEYGKEPRLPDHPHCTHVVSPAR